jgi:hypothetical protein
LGPIQAARGNRVYPAGITTPPILSTVGTGLYIRRVLQTPVYCLCDVRVKWELGLFVFFLHAYYHTAFRLRFGRL